MGTSRPFLGVWRVVVLIAATLLLGISGITAARKLAAPPAPAAAPAPQPASPAPPAPVPAKPAAAASAEPAVPTLPAPEPPQAAPQGQVPAVQPPPRPFGAAPISPFSLNPSPAPAAAPTQFPPGGSPPDNWTSLTNQPGFAASTPILLTDGRVLVEDVQPVGTNTGWHVLTPDNTGSYVNGTWSAVASPQQCYDTTVEPPKLGYLSIWLLPYSLTDGWSRSVENITWHSQTRTLQVTAPSARSTILWPTLGHACRIQARVLISALGRM